MDGVTIEVSDASALAEAIRQHAGTDCRIVWGSFSITFRELSAFERLEFHARRGWVRDPARSKRGWWTGADLIQAEGKKAKVPLASQFKSWEEYLQVMHPSREGLSKYVEDLAKKWDKMPRKTWPKV